MAYRTRTYYTDSQKALMWERWRQGWTLHQIAQLFNRAHTSVQGILSRTGGIRPPERTRSSMALTLVEREEISRAMASGFSIRSIALIGREQPRFTLVVTHIGSDDQELGALGEGLAGDVLEGRALDAALGDAAAHRFDDALRAYAR